MDDRVSMMLLGPSGRSRSREASTTIFFQVSWSEVWEDYKPVDFTAPFVLTATWADPPLEKPGRDLQGCIFCIINHLPLPSSKIFLELLC